MRILRNSTNTRIAIHIDSEAERLLVDKMFKRSLNTWEPQPPALLAAHEQLKAPLNEHAAQQESYDVGESLKTSPATDGCPSILSAPAVAAATKEPTVVPMFGSAKHFRAWWEREGRIITDRRELAELAFDEGHSTHHAESTMPAVFRSNRPLPVRCE